MPMARPPIAGAGGGGGGGGAPFRATVGVWGVDGAGEVPFVLC